MGHSIEEHYSGYKGGYYELDSSSHVDSRGRVMEIHPPSM